MQRVADYVISFIYSLGVKDLFIVPGGGAMFLNDAIAVHKKMNYICNNHEQASVMGAETYSLVTENFGVAIVTSGPGTTNTMTGVLEAWQDSIPCMIISGQSKREQTVYNSKVRGLRQFGFLEVNIIPIIKSITKYSELINDPQKIRYHLEKAVFLAKNGRPGPVWLDIPLDVQGALINEKKLIGFKAERSKKHSLKKEVESLLKDLKSSKKPLIIAGNGIRLSHGINEFKKLVENLKIPVVSSVMGSDLLEDDYPYFVGKAGMKGERSANFAIQNSDLILAIGSRLSVPVIGYDYKKFAPNSKKIVVDIDEVEHRKETIKIDRVIISDAKEFITAFDNVTKGILFNFKDDWVKKLKELRKKYSIFLPEYSKDIKGRVNIYNLLNQINKNSKEEDIIIGDAGSSYYIVRQATKIKNNQRLIIPGATGTMGFNLPASIGAAVASKNKRIICITGDGSLQTNIHELQTIAYHNFPIKIFVLNNKGYLSIRNTQSIYFQGRLLGESEKTGLSIPDTSKIAFAYGLPFYKVKSNQDLKGIIPKVLNQDGPLICEVDCLEYQEIIPSVTSKKLANGKIVSAALDDMYPFLSKGALNKIREDLK